MTPAEIDRIVNPPVFGPFPAMGILRDGLWRPMSPGDTFASIAGDVICSQEHAAYLLAPKPDEPKESVEHLMLYEIYQCDHGKKPNDLPFMMETRKIRTVCYCRTQEEAQRLAKCPAHLFKYIGSDFAITTVPAVRINDQCFLLQHSSPIVIADGP